LVRSPMLTKVEEAEVVVMGSFPLSQGRKRVGRGRENE
jgi:hypothetical protein